MINLGLIGYPLQHSFSPLIHTAALEYCNLPGNYSLFPVLPNDLHRLKDLLDQVRSGETTGLNVTIPFKQTVIPMLDDLTPTAKAIGAVNTISKQNGKLIGENTDSAGFIADLQKFLAKVKLERKEKKNALVLGGGGSARAISYALVNDGWIVTLAIRRPENAKDFLAQFSDYESRVSSIKYQNNAIRSLFPHLQLIVNATPVGMSPKIENSPWSADLSFPQEAVIYDLVYHPHDTKFVLDARAAGLPAITGLGMLVEQAALAFELWTGYDVPREHLFTAVEET